MSGQIDGVSGRYTRQAVGRFHTQIRMVACADLLIPEELLK